MDKWKRYWLINISFWLVGSLLVPLFSMGQILIVIGGGLFTVTVVSLIIFLIWVFWGSDTRYQRQRDIKEPFPDID